MLFSLTSCYEMRVEVHDVPSNTPENAEIYIAGNFNRWDPGDPKYTLKRDDSVFYVDLPRGIGEIEYKFTRGDWTTRETDLCGSDVNNRSAYYGEEEVVVNSILSWNDLDPLDCQYMLLAIRSLPGNTPPDPRIALAGNVNNWDPVEEPLLFEYDSVSGYWLLDVPRLNNIDNLEFLITRGSLERTEADALGEEIKPRIAEFGRQDTVFVEVQSWQDLEKKSGDFITLIVESIPGNTPPDDPIYFVGDINGWYPKQGNLMLEKNRQGNFFINLPLRASGKKFKLTRGGWGKVEVDKYGYEIENRVLDVYNPNDTMVVSIGNWMDLSEEVEDTIRITVLGVPRTTPERADIYLAANFNDWDPGDDDWILNKNDDGTYYIDIPRSWGTFAFKFTRGNWSTVESTPWGENIDNRTYLYKDVDDIEVRIRGWLDRGGG